MLGLVWRIYYAVLRWIFPDHRAKLPAHLKRPLSYIEELYVNLNNVQISVISYTFFIGSKERLTKNKLEQAFTILMKRHPLLRASIETYKGKMYWTLNDDAKPDIKEDSTTNWQGAYLAILSEMFNIRESLLWKVIFMPNVTSQDIEDCEFGSDRAAVGSHSNDARFPHNCALQIKVHHAIIDGQGMVLLIDELQDLLGTPGNTCLNQHSPPNTEIPKPIDDYAYAKMHPLAKMVQNLPDFNFLMGSSLALRLGTLAYGKVNPFERFLGTTKASTFNKEDAKTLIHSLILNSGDFARVRKACKLHAVTVQGVLQTAATIALCQLMEQCVTTEKDRKEFLSSGGTLLIPPQLRKHLKGKEREIYEQQSYVALHGWALDENIAVSDWLNEERFWQLAKKCTESLHRGKHSAFQTFPLIAKFGKDVGPKMFQSLACKSYHLLGFTNHGDCNFLNRDDHPNFGIKIRGLAPVVSLTTFGPVFYHWLTTLDGRLFWSINYSTHVASEEVAREYLDKCLDILLNACQ